jgi:hypothetical protein
VANNIQSHPATRGRSSVIQPAAAPRQAPSTGGYGLLKAERLGEARTIYRWFAPLLALDVSTKLVRNIKRAETIVGFGTEPVRPPRLPLAGDERKARRNADSSGDRNTANAIGRLSRQASPQAARFRVPADSSSDSPSRRCSNPQRPPSVAALKLK